MCTIAGSPLVEDDGIFIGLGSHTPTAIVSVSQSCLLSSLALSVNASTKSPLVEEERGGFHYVPDPG